MPVSRDCRYRRLAYRGWHPIAPEVTLHRRCIVSDNRAPVSGIVRASPSRSWVRSVGARPECGEACRRSYRSETRRNVVRRDPDGKVAWASRLAGVVDTTASRRGGLGETAVRCVSSNGRNVDPSLHTQVPDAAATVSPPGDGVPATTGLGGVWRWHAPQE